MNRFHVHVSVADLAASIRFYSPLFAAEPAVLQPDYAKWMVEEPRLNFAISRRASGHGVDHLGFQVDSDVELATLGQRLAVAALPVDTQRDAACCYARSNKHWTTDPQGVSWESFHTLESAATRGEDHAPAGGAPCCVPTEMESAAQGACCGPDKQRAVGGARCCA